MRLFDNIQLLVLIHETTFHSKIILFNPCAKVSHLLGTGKSRQTGSLLVAVQWCWNSTLQQRDLMFSSSLQAVEFQGMQGSLAAFAGKLRVQWDRSSPCFCGWVVLLFT